MNDTTQDLWTAEALQLFAQVHPGGILLADESGRIRYVNQRACALLHSDGDALEGRHLDQLFVESDVLPLAQILAQDQPWTRLLRVSTAKSEQLILETTLFPLRGEDLTGVAVLLSLPGVQSQAERQYVQAEKLAALDHLVGGIAHELNNPLTVILGYTELLLGRQLEEDVRSRLAIICEKTERCRRIVDNLSRFSRRKNIPKAPANLNEVLLDTLALCEYQLDMDGIRLDLQLPEQLPKVLLRRRDMQSVVFSLINNAHQALLQVVEDQRKLIVASEGLKDRVRLTFSDTGCGIPADIQHKIFDPLFTTREVGEGLGLGLSVAYGIVMEHHGRIWLEYSEPGRTTFVMELPLEGMSLSKRP